MVIGKHRLMRIYLDEEKVMKNFIRRWQNDDWKEEEDRDDKDFLELEKEVYLKLFPWNESVLAVIEDGEMDEERERKAAGKGARRDKNTKNKGKAVEKKEKAIKKKRKSVEKKKGKSTEKKGKSVEKKAKSAPKKKAMLESDSEEEVIDIGSDSEDNEESGSEDESSSSESSSSSNGDSSLEDDE